MRNGYTLDDEKIKNGAYVEDGKLIAIVTDMKIPEETVLTQSVLVRTSLMKMAFMF